MSSKEEGMSEAKDREMIKRKRTDERMRSEIGAIGEGQVPGGWAPSLKNINEKKIKDSRTVNGSGYYNGTAMSVKEMIRAFEHPEERLASSASLASSREASSSWVRDLRKERVMEFTGKESQEYLSPGKRRRLSWRSGGGTAITPSVTRCPPPTPSSARRAALGWAPRGLGPGEGTC